VITVPVRGTTNNRAPGRGGTAQRTARKRWLLATFGDGTLAPCSLQIHPECPGVVDFDTVTVDRYPIPGCEGGGYEHGNIRPACNACNQKHGSQMGVERQRQKRAMPVMADAFREVLAQSHPL
jgi:hypothetical protein